MSTNKHAVTLYLQQKNPFDPSGIHGVVNALDAEWLNISGAINVVTVQLSVSGSSSGRAAFEAALGLCRERIPHLDVIACSVADWRDPQLASQGDFVGVAELATLLGVSRQRASNLARSPGFPKPLAILAAGPIWHRALVSPFVKGNWHRRPGRPSISERSAGHLSTA